LRPIGKAEKVRRILYIQYTNPAGYPPLEHSSRIIADAGWQVLFLGTGAYGASTLEFPSHPNVEVRKIPFCPAGWRQKLHYLAYCLWALWVTLLWRPDWVYASDLLSCPIALVVSWFLAAPVIYHEHDSPESLAQGSRFMRLALRARNRVAKTARLCILPNGNRLRSFQAQTRPAQQPVCLWNVPVVGEVAIQPRGSALPQTWVLYHGSIVPERLSPAVLEALAFLPQSVRLRVVGYEPVGAHGYLDYLKRTARLRGIEDRVEFRGVLLRSDVLAVSLTSDIGLAMVPIRSTDANLATMTGASNKAFDYLACGLPLLVSELSDWREVFVEPGYGVACNPDDPCSIAAAIRRLIDDPERMREMGEKGRQRILSDWNYEKLFRPVLDLISGQVTTEDAADTNTGVENAV